MIARLSGPFTRDKGCLLEFWSLSPKIKHLYFSQPPKLLDRLREALRARHMSRRTEQAYVAWIKRFINFHHVRHPAEMAEPEIKYF